MKETPVLIIGASVAGLACAACLQKKGIGYIIIEKETQIATPWRNHYERLHLHTNKSLSHLPYKKFGSAIPRYPSRAQLLDYMNNYQQTFGIQPLFNTQALSIEKENSYWITGTSAGQFKSKHVILATGAYEKPKDICIKGMETFRGPIIHSSKYKTGKNFKGQKVLVVGFGNSACEIAIDLYEQGAFPSMSVRSPVNIVPRDFLGIPILRVSQLMSKLPARLADALAAPLSRLFFGNIGRLGLQKNKYGIFEQIQRNATVPVIDIGTIKHIRNRNIRIFKGIDCIKGNMVYFLDQQQEHFDAIVAAIGYYSNYAEIIHVEPSRFNELKSPVNKQEHFGKDGLYFCGFYVSATGAIREISNEARKIAANICQKDKAF